MMQAERHAKECEEKVKYHQNLLRNKSEEISLIQKQMIEMEAKAKTMRKEYDQKYEDYRKKVLMASSGTFDSSAQDHRQ